MKFGGLKEFRKGAGDLLSQMERYLQVELAAALRELRNGLTKLSFGENFQCFIVENLSIPASSEVTIRNQMTPVIPSGRLILRSNSSTIVDGDTAWSSSFLTLKNTSGTNATVTVVFFK